MAEKKLSIEIPADVAFRAPGQEAPAAYPFTRYVTDVLLFDNRFSPLDGARASASMRAALSSLKVGDAWLLPVEHFALLKDALKAPQGQHSVPVAWAAWQFIPFADAILLAKDCE